MTHTDGNTTQTASRQAAAGRKLRNTKKTRDMLAQSGMVRVRGVRRGLERFRAVTGPSANC